MFKPAFDVLGTSAGLPSRSALPVTDVPDKTAITVPGTTPVRSAWVTSVGTTASRRIANARPVTALAGTNTAAGRAWLRLAVRGAA